MTVKNWRQDKFDLFLSRNSKRLVITIGDSWTFGDSLGSIYDTGQDDVHARLTQCYGRLIADELCADWLNFGYCGYGNSQIIKCASDLLLGHHADWLNETGYQNIKDRFWPSSLLDVKSAADPAIINEIEKVFCYSLNPYTKIIQNYEKIFVYITMTETGRDAHHYDWILNSCTSTHEYLAREEQYNFDMLIKLQHQSNVDFVIGRNFTESFDGTNTGKILEKTWIQKNHEHLAEQGYANICSFDQICNDGAISGIAFDALVVKQKFLKDYKQYFVEKIGQVDCLWTWLRNNPLHFNKVTCHPRPMGHKVWAEYLLSNTV